MAKNMAKAQYAIAGAARISWQLSQWQRQR
jgi:hypothetical protein